MSARFDLVVRNGAIVDGTGAAAREGDVAVSHGRIDAVGRFDGSGTEEIDAKGRIVAPGFVDIHTHYDGQAVWDSHMAPSAWHGVTTAVMGNCGVGFAPCKPADREKLVELMEGVEDIPGPVMHEGLDWQWESRRPMATTRPSCPALSLIVMASPPARFPDGWSKASAKRSSWPRSKPRIARVTATGLRRASLRRVLAPNCNKRYTW
jgi:Amidohydrolase family